MSSCDREKYLIETVFPSTAESGRFGTGMKFVRYEKDINSDAGIQFASSVVFLSVIVSDSNGKEQILKLVIKFLPESLKVRELMNSIVQFHNENVMYSDILPFLEYNGFGIINKTFPKFYYGESSEAEGKEPVIVVEDLREKGYKNSKFKLFIDYEHVIVALKTLGKFHALSYIAKQKKPGEFNTIKNKLKEHVWDRTDFFSTRSVIGPCALRGVNALYDNNKSTVVEKLIDRLKRDPGVLIKYLVKPEEPTAVICHGDFVNHNVFFKYDDNSPDVPTSIKFFDVQTSRYASPVIDISMLLFLNTEYELRSRHWDEFINCYHSSVVEIVTAAGCVPPSYQQLVAELKNKSFYGYFQCSYFLPMMVGDTMPPSPDDCADLEPKELLEFLCSFGGEKGTQSLVDIVKHLDELNYFGFLDN